MEFQVARHTAFDGMDQKWAQVAWRNNVMESADRESAMHAVDAVEFGRHLAQFLGMDNFK
jgi:hypothetical protein